MRALETNGLTKIFVTDEPGAGNACHKYIIVSRDEYMSKATESPLKTQENFVTTLTHVSFQNGPVKEQGVNGCTNEDLIAIVIDRLWSFQNGPFHCRENRIALQHLEEALHWLNHRTADRQRRGVEGTMQQ